MREDNVSSFSAPGTIDYFRAYFSRWPSWAPFFFSTLAAAICCFYPLQSAYFPTGLYIELFTKVLL
jgi:hypothetical protein